MGSEMVGLYVNFISEKNEFPGIFALALWATWAKTKLERLSYKFYKKKQKQQQQTTNWLAF